MQLTAWEEHANTRRGVGVFYASPPPQERREAGEGGAQVELVQNSNVRRYASSK